MTKTPDRYLETHPWKIVEEGFHPERSRVSESLFSLGNEYQGVRGYFDEGYSGDGLRGCYLGGIFEEHILKEPLDYRGISSRIRFMVNTVDWLSIRLEVDGETLDLGRSRFSDFRRELDFSSGLLRRELVWHTQSGADLRVEFLRLLSMRTKELGMQRLSLTSLRGRAGISVTLGLDFSMLHESYRECFWECHRRSAEDRACAMLGVSRNVTQKLFAGFIPPSPAGGKTRYVEGDRFIGCRLEIELEKGRERIIDKACILAADRERTESEEKTWERGAMLLAEAGSFDQVRQDNAAYWKSIWDASDIVIEGDPEAQQGIRFCVFQLHQTCRGIMDSSNVGAKGLTGEAYNGHVFWDTETYCLPYYLFNNPRAAKSMLDFRHKTLPQAQERARELDCAGACFPVATIDGSESCTLWQHASLQLQPTTAVAYAISHYASVVGDSDFLHGNGVELLVRICRFLASRAQRSPRGGGYGYYGVMGPDEFHMMVNNNCYTNYMARRTFLYTREVLQSMERTCPARRSAVLAALGCTDQEVSRWGEIAQRMIIPFDPNTGLYEQHDGYFDLPHMEVDSIPAEQFPLYAHWSYDRIFRSDMIKQPDVLMLMLLCNGSFSAREKSVNYDYYSSRCIHESSLSPSVHSILASELGRQDDAFALFRFATRIDLDNYNRNTSEGLHMTSIAAAWMNIVYGFGGLRSDGAGISLDPRIPAQWTAYRFPLTCRGSVISVEVDHARARISLVSGPPVEMVIRQRAWKITAEGAEIRMPPGAAGRMEAPCSPSA